MLVSGSGVVDVGRLFGGLDRVLFVHAHPDDESLCTGGMLAALSEAGRDPLVLTLTRGELGRVREGASRGVGVFDAAAFFDSEVVCLRRVELAAALRVLGVSGHAYLGLGCARRSGLRERAYFDSGMRVLADGSVLPALGVSSGSLVGCVREEAVLDIVACARAFGASAFVSYDASGGYGHPDHVRAHELCVAAAGLCGLPMWEVLPAAGTAGGYGVVDVGVSGGLVSGVGVFSLDVRGWLDRKRAALECYGSQLRVCGDTIFHVGGECQPLDVFERVVQRVL